MAGRLLVPRGEKARGPSLHLEVSLPEGERLTSFGHTLALSPDGTKLAFTSGAVDPVFPWRATFQIHLRTLDRWQSRPVVGTEAGEQPFFSPDGKWLGFVWTDPKRGAWPRPHAELRKIAVDGREAVTVCACDATFGASWGADDTIVFAPSLGGLMRVPASGGEPKPLTEPDAAHGEVNHRLPQILPGGRAVLFTAILYHFDVTDWRRARIVAQSLTTGERKVLAEGASDARYIAPVERSLRTGHLVFARAGRLYGAAFDLDRLEFQGPETPVLDGLLHSQNHGDGAIDTGAAHFSVSATGTLAYAPGSVAPELPLSVVRVDRHGREERLPLEERLYLSVRLSPDGRQLLLGTLYPPMGVWLYDLERKTVRRQTFSGWHVAFPLWGPETNSFTFSSDQEGPRAFFSKAVDSGPGAEQKLLVPGAEAWVSSWSPGGKRLAFVSNDAKAGLAIWILARDGQAAPLIQSGFQEMFPEFSPDGSWMAYTSNESGRLEVYVRPYRGPGNVIQVSNAGGTEPAWSRDGREIVFRRLASTSTERNKFFAVTVEARGGRLVAGVPVRLFEDNLFNAWPVRSYDVTPDGHILGLKFPDAQKQASIDAELFPKRIRIVQDWLDELRAKTASAK